MTEKVALQPLALACDMRNVSIPASREHRGELNNLVSSRASRKLLQSLPSHGHTSCLRLDRTQNTPPARLSAKLTSCMQRVCQLPAQSNYTFNLARHLSALVAWAQYNCQSSWPSNAQSSQSSSSRVAAAVAQHRCCVFLSGSCAPGSASTPDCCLQQWPHKQQGSWRGIEAGLQGCTLRLQRYIIKFA